MARTRTLFWFDSPKKKRIADPNSSLGRLQHSAALWIVYTIPSVTANCVKNHWSSLQLKLTRQKVEF